MKKNINLLEIDFKKDFGGFIYNEYIEYKEEHKNILQNIYNVFIEYLLNNIDSYMGGKDYQVIKNILIENYWDSIINDYHSLINDEVDSVLKWQDDCHDFLKDESISDFEEAIACGNVDIESIAKFYLIENINNQISLDYCDLEDIIEQFKSDYEEGIL